MRSNRAVASSRSTFTLALALAALVALPASARAQQLTIMLESYPTQRPKDADGYIKLLVKSLGDEGPLQGVGLRDRVEAELSLPPGPREEPAGVRALVEDGRRQFIEGNYKRAIQILERARGTLTRSAMVVASDQGLRASLHRALMFLAHAYLRTKQGNLATDRMGEVIRGFPGQDLSRVEYGPELEAFYKKVRQQMRRQPRGTLAVAAIPRGCLVFVNERFVGMSPVQVPKLYPGRYRVYVQRPKERGRIHMVTMAGGDYKLLVNFGLDSALITRPWVGFRFDSPGTLRWVESKYAAAVGRALDAPSVLVVGIRRHKGVRSLVGTMISSATGKVVRSALVALEPAPPADEHVSALGLFLMAGKPSDKLQVQFPPPAARVARATTRRVTPAPPAAVAPVERGDGPRWSPLGVTKWVTLGLAVAGLASGITLLALDGQSVPCDLPEGVLCPERYTTQSPGIVLTAAGGSAAVASGVLFFIDARRNPGPSAAVAPWGGRSGGGLVAVIRY